MVVNNIANPTFKESNPQLASLLQYLLLGAGAFSGLRLGSDIHNAQAYGNEKAKDKSTLVIDLPENRNPYFNQQKQAIEKAALSFDILKRLLADYAMPVAVTGAGFAGTKALYDAYQKHKLKKEIDTAKADYMNSLVNFKQASEHVPTPNVDSFCDALANELHKQAGWKLPAALAGGVAGTKAIEALRSNPSNPNSVPQSVLERLYKKIDEGLSEQRPGLNAAPGSGLAKDSFNIGFGGVGLMGLYMLIKANMKRREKEQKRILPSSVALDYQPTNV
jgi:hypothetical protein